MRTYLFAKRFSSHWICLLIRGKEPAVLKSMGESRRKTLKPNISTSNCLQWRNASRKWRSTLQSVGWQCSVIAVSSEIFGLIGPVCPALSIIWEKTKPKPSVVKRPSKVCTFISWRHNDVDMLDFSVFLDASPIDFNTAGTKARFCDVATLPLSFRFLGYPRSALRVYIVTILNHFSQLRESCAKITPPWTENSKTELTDLVYSLRCPVNSFTDWETPTYVGYLNIHAHVALLTTLKEEQREVIHPVTLAV